MIFTHGSKLERKCSQDSSLGPVWEAYRRWRGLSQSITARNKTDVEQLTRHLDEYKRVVEPLLDARPNSGQEVLQSSIIEEFFDYLFAFVERDLIAGLTTGPKAGFIDLVFNPKDIKSLVTAPEYTIRRKDHDFVIGASIQLGIKATGGKDERHETIIVPAIAIECKRYL